MDFAGHLPCQGASKLAHFKARDLSLSFACTLARGHHFIPIRVRRLSNEAIACSSAVAGNGIPNRATLKAKREDCLQFLYDGIGQFELKLILRAFDDERTAEVQLLIELENSLDALPFGYLTAGEILDING